MRALPAPFSVKICFVLCCLAGMTQAQDRSASLSPEVRPLGLSTRSLPKPSALVARERAWSLYGLQALPQWQEDGHWDIDLGLPKDPNQADQQTGGDQLQMVSLNAYRRWSESPLGISPYLGAGIGIELPRSLGLSGELPDQRQMGRAAMQITAGASLELNDNISLFGQLHSGYAFNIGDPKNAASAPEGRMTNGINIGISLGF